MRKIVGLTAGGIGFYMALAAVVAVITDNVFVGVHAALFAAALFLALRLSKK